MKWIIGKKSILIWAVGLALFCSACTTTEEKKDVTETPLVVAPPETTYFSHMVRWSYEKFPMIAAWYTGDISKWQDLEKANPTINGSRLAKGMVVLIPEDLLKTREPMPRTHVVKFLHQKKKKSSQKNREPHVKEKQNDESQLIGPKLTDF